MLTHDNKPTLEKITDVISPSTTPTHTQHCPRCKCAFLVPIIVTKSDTELFDNIMRVCYEVMDETGISENLFALIKSKCLAEIALKKAKGE